MGKTAREANFGGDIRNSIWEMYVRPSGRDVGQSVDRYTSLRLGEVSWLEREIWELAAYKQDVKP